MMAIRSLWCTRDAKNESDSTASTRLNAGQPFTNPAKLFDSELCCRKEVRVEVKELDRMVNGIRTAQAENLSRFIVALISFSSICPAVDSAFVDFSI